MDSFTYNGFYIEVDSGTYLATCYSPWHLIRDKDLDTLKRKIDDFLRKA